VCKLPRGTEKLPATRRRGLVQHLLQYPVVGLATPVQRARAERVLAQLVSADATCDDESENHHAKSCYQVTFVTHRSRISPRKRGGYASSP